MKNYKLQLNEVFGDPYKYEYTSVGTGIGGYGYKFKTENDTIFVLFSKLREMHKIKGKNPILYNMSFNSMDAKSSNLDEPTNKGDAFRVFATLIKIVQEFYKKSTVGGIVISSKDTASRSRKMIYKRLIKKFGSGQNVEKVKDYKDLYWSMPALQQGILVYKKDVQVINPLDAIMRKTQAKFPAGAFSR